MELLNNNTNNNNPVNPSICSVFLSTLDWCSCLCFRQVMWWLERWWKNLFYPEQTLSKLELDQVSWLAVHSESALLYLCAWDACFCIHVGYIYSLRIYLFSYNNPVDLGSHDSPWCWYSLTLHSIIGCSFFHLDMGFRAKMMMLQRVWVEEIVFPLLSCLDCLLPEVSDLPNSAWQIASSEP